MKLQEYQPRDVFLPLHNRQKRWTTVVAHRRAGKTVAMCADLVIGALETNLPRPQFAYLAPFREQAKRVAWQYLKELTKDFQASPPNESELRIDIQNGHKDISRIYVAGADNPDALRGMYFDGVVLDETGQIRPSAWYSVLRPALSDRKGWAIFAGTPAGKNFFWQIREEARLNPDTHLLLELPASKTGILDAEELIAKREAAKQQSAVLESYHDLEEEARTKYDDFEQVAYNPKLPITNVMAETIQSSDIGPELAYYLGSNPKEADRISRMTPLGQAKEIGKIEAKLVSTPLIKKTTSAPAPISPVTARSAGVSAYDTTDPRSTKTMTDSQWIEAERKRQIKKWEAQNR